MNPPDKQTRMIAPDLVETGAAATRIVAGRRVSDGRVVFPMPTHENDHSNYERIVLSERGTLWSWTVQRCRPKSPPYLGADGDDFRPFFVGYVEFPEGVIVEGWIDAKVDVDELHIGMPMDTTVIPIFMDKEGKAIHAHAFRPVKSSNHSNRS